VVTSAAEIVREMAVEVETVGEKTMMELVRDTVT
jgi:hypothetical protein